MGGMVLETNMTEILSRIEDQNKMEKQEVSFWIIVTYSQYLLHAMSDTMLRKFFIKQLYYLLFKNKPIWF